MPYDSAGNEQRIEALDGGSQRVSIGSSAARSTQLADEGTYHVTSKADCWVVVGSVTVDAVVGEDYFIPAYSDPFVVVADAGNSKDYISVIRDAADSTNGLSICKVTA